MSVLSDLFCLPGPSRHRNAFFVVATKENFEQNDYGSLIPPQQHDIVRALRDITAATSCPTREKERIQDMLSNLYGYWKLFLAASAATLLLGCAIPQTHSSIQHRALTLQPQDLERHGLAFITPSTVTGQEEEKQAVALTFSDVLRTKRPDIPVMTLSQTLTAVNQAGIEDHYKRMFDEYRDTGLFKLDSLRVVSRATGMRYIGQLKLSGFTQASDGRLSVFGLRVFSTKIARLRLFFQIWDSAEGSIAWEGMDELEYAEDTPMEKTVTLKKVIDKAASDLVDRLPTVPDMTVRP
jgi:hypothetical protein